MSNDPIYSTKIRAGKTTFFVDVREAKNGTEYLAITESRLNGEKSERKTLCIFGETVGEFRKAIDEAADVLSPK